MTLIRKDHIVEIKYAISQLSSRVKQWKQKDANSWNFRCPICGDSHKSKVKARGNIYKNTKGNFSFKCFNCGESMSVQQLLKLHFKDLYEEYRMAIFKDRSHVQNTPKNVYIPKKAFDKKSLVISEKNFHARSFLTDRKIPEDYWKHFYFCNKLGSFIRKNRTDGKYNKINDEGEFLVTPIYNWVEGTEKKVVQALCCRNLDVSSKFRYIHAKLRDDCIDDQVIWGLDKLDKTKPILCVEGIFDAVFLDNAIAMLTSVKTLKGYDGCNVIYVIDNEPRNKEIVKIVKNHIDAGRTVSLLPEKYLELGKDINDYIKAGITKDQLMQDILKHTYSGPRAILEFSKWKKI